MIKLRYLFFLLILINVIFFLWSLRTGMAVKAEIPLVTMNSGEKQIFLAREVKTPEPKKKKKIKKRIKPKKKPIRALQPLIEPEAVIEQPIAPLEFVIDPSSIHVVTDQQQEQAVVASPPDASSNLVKPVTDAEQSQSVVRPASDSVNEAVKPPKKPVQVTRKPIASSEKVRDSTIRPQEIIDSEQNQSVLP